MRLLLAEDDPEQRGLLAGILAAHGHAVRTAVSAPEAMAELKADPPDVLLLDLVMRGPTTPGQDGPWLLSEMAAGVAPRVPVVVTTAWPIDPPPKLAVPVTILRKPFAVEELLATLAAVGPAGKGV